MDITPPSATPCVDPGADLASLLDAAATDGVAMAAYIADGEVWISDVQRSSNALKGLGKFHIRVVQRFAAERGLSVGLAVWAVNDALRNYYAALGFRVVHEPTEDELDGADDHAVMQWRSDLDATPARDYQAGAPA